MNDIDKMPVKCRDCPYWELATFPWYCGDCVDKMNPKNGEYIKRIDAKRALTALPADLDAEAVQRCIEAVDRVPPARANKSAKKEKVLKTIKNCILKSNPGSPVLCEECPYYEFLYADDNEDDCLMRLMRDAVEIMEGE